MGDDVVIQGSSVTAYNKRFTNVASVSGDGKSFSLSASGLPGPPGTTAGVTVRRHVPAPMRVKSATLSGADLIVETYEPHFRGARIPTEAVRISGITVSGLTANHFNGSFL